MNLGGSIWDDEKIDKRLEEHWAKGYSCSVIAQKLMEEFKPRRTITRNAVIGRVHRRGLPMRGWAFNGVMTARARAAQSSRAKAGLALKPGPRSEKGHSKPRRAPERPFLIVKVANPPPDPERASWVAWEDLEPGMCRYVHGEPGKGHGYCGKDAIPGDAWCKEHRAVVYMPIEVSRRRRVRTDDTELKIAEVRRLMEHFG